MFERGGWRALVVALGIGVSSAASAQPAAAAADPYAGVDRIFEDFQLDAHLPGLVYGIVRDGQLVHVGAFGVQDLDSRRPVTADTLFRIASMTKAFTALTVLKLRDEGAVDLDAPAAKYVPELAGWTYPTTDSAPIRVRDLLNHTAGFATDDPWGDRQTPLPEAEFTRLLREGVPFTAPPATRYEYSNLGYALLGRTITNVSNSPFEATITRTLLAPLGMASSGFVADAAPAMRRALGYRWVDEAWKPEPYLGPGAFGAMGGLQTSANDYAKWVGFLLSAWPPRDGADNGPVRRSTVRELAQGSNFPRLRPRPARSGAPVCQQAANYAMGFNVAVDCDLGLTLSHGGGYPGYGSHLLLLPDRGIGIFALANRTYAGPSIPVWDAALAMLKAGELGEVHATAMSPALESAYREAGKIWAAGRVDGSRERLAMNFLLDRDAAGWVRELARVKAQVGECATDAPLAPTGAMSADFSWRCSHGRVNGSLLLAPIPSAPIQELRLSPVKP